MLQYFVEEADLAEADVEYSVSRAAVARCSIGDPGVGACCPLTTLWTIFSLRPFCQLAAPPAAPAARRADAAAGRLGNICDQQADAQPPGLDELTTQRARALRLGARWVCTAGGGAQVAEGGAESLAACAVQAAAML